MQVWTLADKFKSNFLSGHPWVYANELVGNIRSVQPGEIVELKDEKKRFLAFGYANPHSKIAFRELSRHKDFLSYSKSLVLDRLLIAAEKRKSLGYHFNSHRLCFSEGDLLPGLIIDCFFTDKKQVLVVQILTAGMEKLIKDASATLISFLEQCNQRNFPYFSSQDTILIIKRDSASRKQEVLEILPPQVVNFHDEFNLSDLAVNIRSSIDPDNTIKLSADFITGQKTGMFLDQSKNIDLLISHISKGRPLKILDLFCYVGQWGAQLANATQNKKTEVSLVDASADALNFAKKNVAQFCDKVSTTKIDIVEKCSELPEQYFDVVICDPPALIKSKRDFHSGFRAYQKVNRYALRALKPGGLFMSCSCSQALSLKDLKSAIEFAGKKENRVLKELALGGQSEDHVYFKEFPQGFYLKGSLLKDMTIIG